MKARLFPALAIQASLVLMMGTTPRAANALGADSDIIGLRLTMNRDEARKLIESGYPGAVVTALPVVVTADNFEKSAIAGFVVDLATKDDKAANQAKSDQFQKEFEARKAAGMGDSPLNRSVVATGDFAQDRVKVLFNPNDGATDIFGISRYTEYASTKQPVTKTMVDALTAKYGAPSRTGGSSIVVTYTWAGPGVIERTRTSPTHCYEDAGFDFLYENVGDAGFYGMPQLVSSTSNSFVNAVNLIHSKNMNRNYSICGTVLQVRLKLTRNGDYVGAMGIRLIDLTRAYSELGTFGDAFWRQAAAAKQKQINTDSANKPKL